MTVDRSMRNALAAILLVAALFVAMNQIVASAPFADWWLPVLLFVIGAALVFAPSFGRAPSSEDAAASPENAVQTYLVAPPAPQLPTPATESAAEPDVVIPFADSTPEIAAEAEIIEPETVEPEVSPAAEIAPEPEAPELEVSLGSADDLTKINGIGAKSAAALKAAGIDSFQKLANSSEDTLRAAISSAGVRLVGDVTTWAQQAGYAARGDWQGLSRYNAERRAANGD